MTKRKPTIKQLYKSRYEANLVDIANKLEADLWQNIGSYPRIDTIKCRAKSIERFCVKARKENNGIKKYSDPINQIQDQIGARIVTFYLDDVDKIARKIEKYYRPVEKQKIIPDSDNKFGYEERHYVLFLPVATLPNLNGGDFPVFFELQITTLFQHAWSEAEHDLNYKPNIPIDRENKRKIAFTAAQAWGADNIFNELFSSTKPKKKNK